MRLQLLFLAALMAQPGVAMAQDAAAPVFKVEQLTPTVALVLGPGGDVTVGHGPGELVLVDAEVAQLSPQLIAAVRALDPRPVRTVINTHWHFDHVGGDEALAKAGATIVAQANVQARMAKGGTIAFAQMTIPPASKAALPTRTYETSLSISAGGDVLKLVHVPNAHTDGDTLVKWTRANILDMGDVYIRYGLPFVDISSGGSLKGFIAAVDRGLALSDEHTTIIPGHGEPATRRDLVAYRDQLQQIATAVEDQVRAGKSLAEIQALRLADGWVQGADAFVKPDAFIAIAYESLKTEAEPAGPSRP